MNRFDRILGILLFLRSTKSVSAADLAERFEVSRRTIYRDIEMLSALGVPVYAERGREGGFQLLEGYFLPPLMFSTGEAISLLLGLTLLNSLQAKPFMAELETAEKKLLAAVPDRLRSILAEVEKIIGLEKLPGDIFHPEVAEPRSLEKILTAEPAETMESKTVGVFLQAILDQREVRLHYRSPYRAKTQNLTAEPLGIFWDRDHWYLVGRQTKQDQTERLWRADRVLEIKPQRSSAASPLDFDVRELLGRNWLRSAMAHWIEAFPVQIRLSPLQAARLQQDWYYRHAYFERISENDIVMTWGEDNPAVVLELLRWLGPGAELIEPKAWRSVIKEELEQMLTEYTPR